MSAGKVEVSHKAIVLVINESYDSDVVSAGKDNEAEALYEATRGVWEISDEGMDVVEYALGLYKGKVKEVYRIKGWHKAGTLIYHHRPPHRVDPKVNNEHQGKMEFEKTVVIDEEVRKRYLGKRINIRPYGRLTYSKSCKM